MTTTTNDLNVTIGEAISRLMPDGVPFRFTLPSERFMTRPTRKPRSLSSPAP